jgi:DNA mismatch endonuclease (patch repair protein)
MMDREVDSLSPEKRSWNMSRINGKDTVPERVVRSLLHRLGFRFRLHRRDLPGLPDIVLASKKTVILVHGCYWHRHPGCKYAYTPKSHVDFWRAKFDDNVTRDAKVRQELKELGWQVHVVWECETRNLDELRDRLGKVLG